MSKETEKALRAMRQFLAENGVENMPIEEVNKLVQEFTVDYNSKLPTRLTEKNAKTADDYLELAEQTPIKAKAEKYIKKALELEPDNLDAVSASLGSLDCNSWEDYQKLSKAVKKGAELMEREGLMDEDCIGKFWGIFETRPYMRLLERYVIFMVDAGMTTLAAKECEEMLRLSEGDNLGVRFRLMHIYAFLDREESALALYKKYDGDENTQMLLPLSILYFKRGDFGKAREYLKRLSKVNKDVKKFFTAIIKDKLESYIKEIPDYGYHPFTIQELIVELSENSFLFNTAPLYMEWAYEETRNM